ncbi:homeobox-like protein HDP1 isoform X2 [Prorops nasuta]
MSTSTKASDLAECPNIILNMQESLKIDDKSNIINIVIDEPDVDQPRSLCDLSILNRSAMNDTLFDSSCSSEENQIKSIVQQRISLCIQKGTIAAENLLQVNTHMQPSKMRSFSLGDNYTPKKNSSVKRRSKSIVEILKEGLPSPIENTFLSSCSNISNGTLNKGFLSTDCSENSVFSDISNTSSIPKQSSTSSTIYNGSSSMLSNGTLNRCFISSLSSTFSDCPQLKMNPCIKSYSEPKTRSMSLNKTESFQTLINKEIVVSDLTERFNKLKAKSIDLEVIRNVNSEEYHLVENNKQTSNSLGKNSFRDRSSESYGPDNLSDSVFIDNEKINSPLIPGERSLAKTFEELVEKSSLNSSTDDLISNNYSWLSELLPAFDDENMVDNLIDLPSSTDSSDIKSAEEERLKESQATSPKCNTVEDDLEKELISPNTIKNKVAATTLLLDLEKIVKMDNNLEAINLLNRLQKALGIEYKSNIELLNTCLYYSDETDNMNNLQANKVKELETATIDHNYSTRELSQSIESLKVSNITHTCSPNNETGNNENKPEQDNVQNVLEINDIDTFNNSDELKVASVVDCIEKTNVPMDKKVEESTKEAIALNILINLGKLLNEKTKELSVLELTNSLQRAFALATMKEDVKNQETSSAESPVVSSPNKTKSERRSLSKSLNKKSPPSKIRSPSKKNFKRSMSIINNSLHDNPLTSVGKDKSKTHLMYIKKRFSSDPGLSNNMPSKSFMKSVKEKTETFDAPTNIQQDNPMSSALKVVKTKLQNKSDTSVVNKKGPMKAVLPLKKMQKLGALKKETELDISPTTNSHAPVFTITSSTPNSEDQNFVPTNSMKVKPMASSTPDLEHTKSNKTKTQIIKNSPKRSITDVSPVTQIKSINGTKNSPKKISRIASPLRRTPNRQSCTAVESGIPKYSRSPKIAIKDSSAEFLLLEEDCNRSTQSFSVNADDIRKTPLSLRKRRIDAGQSPLKDINTAPSKVRPLNLIWKFQQRGNGNSIMEKENYA